MTRRGLLLGAVLVLVLALAPLDVRANGAFPDSFQIFAPKSVPGLIILPANFGLMITHDEGDTWHWVCEQDIAAFVYSYQIGPGPGHELYALTLEQPRVSSDLGCRWTGVDRPLVDFVFDDLFPSPADDLRVLALGRATSTTPPSRMEDSSDRGMTWKLRYVAPPELALLSVETASTSSVTIYATLTSTFTSTTSPPHPWLVRSFDLFKTYELLDVQAEIGERRALIITIDPRNALRIVFRVRGAAGETGDWVGISEDGGETIRLVRQLQGSMSTFLLRESGEMIAATLNEIVSSSDGGMTWRPWPANPSTMVHPRGLAERAGCIYAAASNFGDGFAVARTCDNGSTWTPLFSFADIDGLLPDCPEVQTTCAVPWRDLQCLFGIGACAPIQPDAGMTASEGEDHGCGCSALAASKRGGALQFLFAVISLLCWGLLRVDGRRCCNRGRRCPCPSGRVDP